MNNFFLIPLSALYKLASNLKYIWFRYIFCPAKAKIPVISVGNIKTGGTGKTPFVIWLATRLRLFRPVIIVRGYTGQLDMTSPHIVSDGQRIYYTPSEVSDEAVLISQKLLKYKIPVIACKRRLSAINLGIRTFNSRLAILDDGFQYWNLKRDLDIALIDTTDPFSNFKMLPAGRLREPLHRLKRADIILLTKTEQANEREVELLKRTLVDHGINSPVFKCRYQLSEDDLTEVRSSRGMWGNFSALGNPATFTRTLNQYGIQTINVANFPDHYCLTVQDYQNINNLVSENQLIGLVTTEKDYVKLEPARFNVPLKALELKLDIKNEDLLYKLISPVITQ